MALRESAFNCLVAFAVTGFALSMSSASAQAQSLCGNDRYNCHHTGHVAAQPQYYYHSACGSCGNRGLFTSTWVQSAPCGTCQQAIVAPQPCGYYTPCQARLVPHTPYREDVDDDDEGVAPTYHHYRHARFHSHHSSVERPMRRYHHYPIVRAYD